MTTTVSESAAGCLAAVERLTERRPYQWQSRLLIDHFLKGDIPDAVDVPTGLGKTTVMALWLAALAHGARLPRRLIYVVDRRVVVDQASAEADALADSLGDGTSDDSALAAFRTSLQLADRQKLAVSTLRGQHVDNRAWLADPSSPAIVVGTVDMIGSRLLFNGYGVSPRMRPVHAGLLGVDALLVLDEAHLVPPFEALIRRIQELRCQHAPPPIPPFRVMSLSATGRTQAPNVFRLQVGDWETDQALRVRLHAPKRLRLTEEVPVANLPAALAGQAWDLAQPAAATLVFCNSRKVAQDTAQILAKRLRDTFGKEAAAPELLVGERRVRERELLDLRPVFQRFLPRRHASIRAAHTTPAFLVATSAGEVGIDLDADHIVCDLVEWERMVQRLGRVNRRVEPAADARVVIVPAVMERKKNEVEDDIDSKRLEELKAPFQSRFWPVTIDGWRDASPVQLYRLKSDEQLAKILSEAQTPEVLRPLLAPALIDAWAMTSLTEGIGQPEVQPWLRGWVKDDPPQTRVVWRQHFPLRTADAGETGDGSDRRRDLREFLDVAAPHLSEALDAPTYRVVDVLRKRADAWSKANSAAMGGPSSTQPQPLLLTLKADGTLEEIYGARWLMKQKPDTIQWLLKDRTVIVDARLGGLDENGLLDPAASSPVLTLDGDADKWGRDLTEMAGFRIRKVKTSAPDDSDDGVDWRVEFRWRHDPEDESDESTEIRVKVWRGPRVGAAAYARGNSALTRKPQTLDDHLKQMAWSVEALARRLGLQTEHVAMLVAVALAHDLGKNRELWQNAMGAARHGRPFAKTAGRCVPRMLEIGEETYRHEFGSLREALGNSPLTNLTAEWKELALHLVAAHHGCARPVIAPLDPDPNARRLACEAIARDAAQRFFRMHTQWGPWGLAWWESLVRAADWHASTQSSPDAEGE